MLEIVTIPTKKVDFQWKHLEDDNISITIDWGDGTKRTYKDPENCSHKYKKNEEHTIIVTTENYHELTLEDCSFIKSINGILPRRNIELVGILKNCINLEYVSNDFFNENLDKEDISYLCSNCYKLRTLDFILPLKNIVTANNFLQGTYMINIDKLAGWGENVKYLNYAFKDRKYNKAPCENIVSGMPNLLYAEGLFENNYVIGNVYNYFIHNNKLVSIYKAFHGCNIDYIDPNWLSYLPSTVETKYEDIFDKDVNINYELR